ncbi:deSI-like protein At4g17486 [Vigna radiata var. radiata]|uniref:DeSI-like protein At4g17486 n=1 Tax=Vigna radiata var. radiata TaxID=3916 RepID=A0A1S3TRB5_VIGRR|nr:deSI-like protein At4g17486 [Vigna radiata var. radiata]
MTLYRWVGDPIPLQLNGQMKLEKGTKWNILPNGIFQVEPTRCPGFTFRKSIFIGLTDMGTRDVRELMERMDKDYSGNTYHLIQKKCNHFRNDVCVKLTGKSTPPWLNRLPRLGFLCNYVLPPNLNETKVRQVTLDRVQDEEKKKVRMHSSRYEASPKPPLSSSRRHCLPSSSVINVSPSSTIIVK